MGNKFSSIIPTCPITRNRVVANIQSALQSYLGDNYTIILMKVSNDEFTLRNLERGQMAEISTGNTVMPDLTATRLVYESTVPFFSRLFLCTNNNSKDTKFLYAWNVRGSNARWQWHIGSPYSSGGNGSTVQFSNENITSSRNSVPAIVHSFANMLPGTRTRTPFKNDMFVWTRTGPDANFDVSKATEGLYWRAQETGPAVTLTDQVALKGRFRFNQN